MAPRRHHRGLKLAGRWATEKVALCWCPEPVFHLDPGRREVDLPRLRMAIRTELDGETAVLTADVLPEPARTRATGVQWVRRGSAERCRATVALSVRLSVTTADSRLTMSATADRAQAAMGRKADSLRSTLAGAIWPGLPARDRHLRPWLLTGDRTRAVTIVTTRLSRPVRVPVRVPVRE